MRFHYGQPPASRTFDPVAAGWTPLRADGIQRYVWKAMALALPLMLVALAMVLHYASQWRAALDAHAWGLPAFALALLLVVPVHEGLHTLAYGCGLRSPNLILGLWPQRGLVYVLCDAPLPRHRILVMLAAPFALLTLLLLAALAIVPPEMRSLIGFFLCAHAAACAGDALTFARVWRQVPPHALVHNQGSTTYWGTTASRAPGA